MNKAIYRISLDIHDTGSQISLSVKKGDTARSIYITLTENGKPYKIAEGCLAVLSGKKADGNYLYNDCIIKDNIIIYDFTKQTTPVVGKVDCEVNLYDANGDNITSPHFVLIVEDKVYNGEEIESSPEATALIQAVFQAEESEQKAETSAKAAKSAQEAAKSSADEAKESADATAECLNEIKNKLANGEFKGEPGETPSLDGVIQFWQPNTEYKVGDVVIANLPEVLVFEDNLYFPEPSRTIIAKCVRQHTSDNVSFALDNNELGSDDEGTWEILQETKAYYDALGRGIHNTYATKEEIVGTLGTINEVLATLVEVE